MFKSIYEREKELKLNERTFIKFELEQSIYLHMRLKEVTKTENFISDPKVRRVNITKKERSKLREIAGNNNVTFQNLIHFILSQFILFNKNKENEKKHYLFTNIKCSTKNLPNITDFAKLKNKIHENYRTTN